MSPRLRTSSHNEYISIKLPSCLKQRFLDRADRDPNRRIRPNSSLQIVNALMHLLPFPRLNLILQVQLDRQTGVGDLDGMNDAEGPIHLDHCLMGIAEHSF